MHANEMVGEGRVGHDIADGRHVATDAARFRVYRTRDWLDRARSLILRPPERAMARSDSGPEWHDRHFDSYCVCRFNDIAMRVVASDAVERVVAFAITAAPGERRRLEPHGGRLFR